MKETYKELDFEVIGFSSEDVITTSTLTGMSSSFTKNDTGTNDDIDLDTE